MFGQNGKDPGMKTLDEIHQLFSQATRELTKAVGVPLCMPNCGKCCEINSISVKGVEARYASLWLRKQPHEFQEEVISRCSKWLFEKFEKVGTKYGLGTVGMPPSVIDQLNQEVAWLGQKSACPMLTEDKRCIIYPVRPIICQAYGVSRVVAYDVCQRPRGKIEAKQCRAYLNNKTIDKIKGLIEHLKEEVKNSPYIETQGFIATMLFLEMKPQKFMEHAYHNEIASAKLVQLTGGYFMWQSQLQETLDREDEIRMLVNPMPIDVNQEKLESIV